MLTKGLTLWDHGVGSTDHFSALKIWMFENKFVSLPSHLKTIVISRTDPMIPK